MGIVNPSHVVAINYAEKDEYRIPIVPFNFTIRNGGQCCFESFSDNFQKGEMIILDLCGKLAC